MPLARHSTRSACSPMFVKRTGGRVRLNRASPSVAGGIIAVKRYSHVQHYGRYRPANATTQAAIATTGTGGGIVSHETKRVLETTAHAGMVQTPASNEGPRATNRQKILDSISHHLSHDKQRTRRV